MAVINLDVVVANLDSVLGVFDRIKIHRSTTGSLGPYTEVTTPTTRLVLESGKVVYRYQDTDGSDAYYYRVSYYHSVSGLESSLSEPQQGEADAALSVISVEELKNHYLFGVDLTKDDGEAYPNSMFEFYIKSAVSEIEHKLDIPIRPASYSDERHDYNKVDYEQYISLYLDHYPVIAVEEVRMVLPTGQVVFNFPAEWLQLQREWGHLNIVPGIGSIGAVLIGATGAFLPFVTRADFLPGVFRVKYSAGFETGHVPDDIRDLVGMAAALGPLNIAGDLIAGAGIANFSVSLDGISQSIGTTSSATNAGYGARILQYIKQIKERIPVVQRYYKGIRLAVA